MIHTPYFIKQEQKKPVQNRVRNSIPTFLIKTYEMLENQEHKDIVCWSEDGKSFLIKKHNEFRDQVLPQYFKHNNYSSFVRQLNMYDFHKVRNEGTDSEYKNTQFIRGQPKLMNEIKRKSGENYMGEDQFSNNQQPSEGLIDGGEGGMQIPSNASINNNNNNQSTKSDNDLNSNNALQDNPNISGNSFLSEVVNFKSKQKDLEKAMTMLIKQHEALIKENKILWDEIRKQVEVDEKKSNQLIMVLAFYLSNFNASTHPNQSAMGMPSFASNSNNANPSNNMHANSNSSHLSSSNNNNRTLSIPTINHKFQSSCEDFDLASFLQPQRYNMDEIQKLMQDTNSLRAASGATGGGSYTQENNLKNCSFGMPVYPLPLNKKPKGNNSTSTIPSSAEFPANVSNQQIQKLFESYNCGDKQSKEKIAAYLQGIINNTKNIEGNRQQRMNNYSLPYEPPSPPLVHEKHSISVFENPCVKRICDQSDNPLLSTKMLPAPEPITTTTVANCMENMSNNNHNMSKTMMMIGNNDNNIQNDTNLMQSRQIMDSFKNESAVFPSNEYLMNTLMNSSHANATNALNSNNNNSNALDLLSLSRANSTNNFNGIPLFNDVKYFSDQQQSQQQQQTNANNSSNKYSPSPLLSRDIENPNILHSPGYFAHGSFTPVHNYNAEDDGFFMGSRRNSFHLPEHKQQESQMILSSNNQNNNNNNSQGNNNNNNDNNNQFSSINS